MTEQVYDAPAATFKVDAAPAPVFSVPVMAQGRAALEAINDVRSVFWGGGVQGWVGVCGWWVGGWVRVGCDRRVGPHPGGANSRRKAVLVVVCGGVCVCVCRGGGGVDCTCVCVCSWTKRREADDD
jgi:hypothetical protein